ncbi:LysR family transcriptional regulator [Bradyrhizobium brasilense]|uniref:LysR family transcriptional regulator n=1 Tax=Bradyrhizobium brasilense TaxID=1419277 RepID=A0ABY8JD74_9BRAD|nr:LysR family transcriptional regulator [Bradyrhizobium brasilense]WFU62659.1 LysR family transcriptional regulator [Bradyrhizobium brasilense]
MSKNFVRCCRIRKSDNGAKDLTLPKLGVGKRGLAEYILIYEACFASPLSIWRRKMQNLDLDLLRAFVMVSETSSFTKASERLFRTQAAISMQIKRLEDRIGKPLFVRGPHGTQLTTAGELLIHYARRILLLNDEAHANLSVSQADDVVRIGVSDDYARILLPDVLLLFNKDCPHAQLDIVVEDHFNLVQEVRDGNVDLAVLIRRSESGDGELLRRDKLHWITSMQNSPHTLDLLPLALCSRGCIRREVALRALKEVDRSFKLVLSSATMAPIVAAVSAGMAISVAEDSLIPAGVRQLGETEGLPSLCTVDLVLYRTPGHQRRPAAMLAEHIRLSLSRRTASPKTLQVAQSAAE